MDLVNKINIYNAYKALFFLFVPLLLIIVDNGNVRASISDYAYGCVDGNIITTLVFGFLIGASGFLFADNGVTKNKWYNIVLGISLLIVAITPHKDYTIIHYTAAVIFFTGSCAAMIIYSSTKQRVYKIIASIVIVVALVAHFIFNWWSLLVAEWIGMLPISIHFIGESLNKID